MLAIVSAGHIGLYDIKTYCDNIYHNKLKSTILRICGGNSGLDFL